MSGFQNGNNVVSSGFGRLSLYSEYVTRKANQVTRVDISVPFEHVAMSELLGRVYHACKNATDYQGKSVTVSGEKLSQRYFILHQRQGFIFGIWCDGGGV